LSYWEILCDVSQSSIFPLACRHALRNSAGLAASFFCSKAEAIHATGAPVRMFKDIRNMTLSSALTNQILSYLNCGREKPSIRYLNQLVRAYIRHVPWESVSRIIKRNTTPETELCPRLPNEFWQEALKYGTGGTCFENNLAFFTLLNGLGFEGYLTINDMENPACHTASTIRLNGQKYLVDVAIPIHAALPIYDERISRRSTEFHQYTIRPVGKHSYSIERSHHPKRKIFTLIDAPIPLEKYREAIKRDYEETGYFLDRVIIVKVIENRLWRFSSVDIPFKLESFDKTSKQEMLLETNLLAKSISEHFEIDRDKIELALSYKHIV
jgi:arylamine N-acetyltransferase